MDSVPFCLRNGEIVEVITSRDVGSDYCFVRCLLNAEEY